MVITTDAKEHYKLVLAMVSNFIRQFQFKNKTINDPLAPPQDDSSSEETQGSSSNPKPIVPPRPRNLTFDHKIKTGNSPNVVKQRGAYETVEFPDLDSNGDRKCSIHFLYI